MKIGIDCRYLGLSGIGRFLENLLEFLDYSKFEYVLFGKKEKIDKYTKASHVYVNESPFSKSGLFNKAFKITKNFDYFYSPNFIIPYTIKCKVITTLHDIIFLDMPEINSGKIEMIIKKHLLKRCVKRSEWVFTVSNFSKERISNYFPKYKNKIIVGYQGIEESFKTFKHSLEKENYIIFVGNIKKQKGLSVLIDAFNMIKDNDLKLYIVGDSKNFKNKDDSIMKKMDNPNILFTGFISDDELKEKVARAKFLIQPSTYEGFGLPPLEALYLGTKPIISNIAVFKEVYSDLPVEFFEVNDSKDLCNKILSTDYKMEMVDTNYLNDKFSPKKYAIMIEDKFK